MCDPAQRIGTYAPSSGSGGSPTISTVTDIDCISLETLLLNTQTLTIGGIPYTSVSFDSFLQKTQYQTGSGPPSLTTFTGSVAVSSITSNGGYLTTNTLFADNIGPTTIKGNVTFAGPLTLPGVITIASLSTTGGSLVTALQPNLNVAENVSMFLGSFNSTNNGAQIQFNYLLLGSATNNLVLKMVGASSQIAVSGTTNTITGPLTLQTLPILPRIIAAGQTFASTVTSNTFTFNPSCRRIEIGFVNVIRKNPNNFESVIQFGVQPSTFDTTIGNYQGSVLGNSNANSVYWSVFPGIPIMDDWPTGGTSGDFLWSGRIVISYFGVVSGLTRWTVSGQMSTPSIVNISGTNFGPYNVWHFGHYSTNTTIDMLRVTNQDVTNTFLSGYMTITTE